MEYSVVIPVFNEAENVRPLADEVRTALDGVDNYEIVFVDDGSTDDSMRRLLRLRDADPRIRVIAHERNAGQSAALATGVAAARGGWVVTLDGDGQNDPADIPRLIAERERSAADLVAGWRRRRHDTWLKRVSSRVANGVRRRVLGDDCPDTGCGLKLFRRSIFLALPHFDHMHRFLPALFRQAGAGVATVPVNHRARRAGRSKYGLGNRLWVGIVDLFGVLWLRHRRLSVGHHEVRP
ncbi:Dodecaprenyl-phosphate galacturonate synthase [wastewater metagenome]|uniref:Dodecaprenyl-phosphate galacturonate synthase n=2 Tax=unclassified sequences TaxID=12908 RepID=A0A5B8R5L1_9ZZZZ|nr:glycosyltransferase family 2 protein [Arhodomonas sp. KWT]QEA03751.1 dodecaprenyl-phosphate galacturonate synthase [uncultured organism]